MRSLVAGFRVHEAWGVGIGKVHDGLESTVQVLNTTTGDECSGIRV